MKDFSFSQLQQYLKAELHGKDLQFRRVNMDSRKIKAGEVFLAVQGEKFDGHSFVNDAIERGASGVILQETLSNNKVPCLKVKNTKEALAALASLRREQYSKPIIGLTGSNGKTTTKAILASILRQKHPVLAPETSMNNDLGLPLTLIDLEETHDFAVIEMGTNHFGEISYLTKIAKPDYAMITNIAGAHLEFFGDLHGVVKAKAEIFEGLDSKGTAILNADDPFTPELKKYLTTQSIVTFGTGTNADVRGNFLSLNKEGYPQFEIILPNSKFTATLPILGKHNMNNALAAATAAFCLGITAAEIKAGIESAQPVVKRLVKKIGKNQSVIIDDSYSAIPNAVNAAIDILADCQGKKIFVFGGMAELIPNDRVRFHKEVGEYAKTKGIHELYAVGPYSQHTVDSFGVGGKYFQDKESLITALQNKLEPNVTLLVKGSRGAKMEDVVSTLISKDI